MNLAFVLLHSSTRFNGSIKCIVDDFYLKIAYFVLLTSFEGFHVVAKNNIAHLIFVLFLLASS